MGHSFSSKERLLISWLQSLSAVILEPKKIKSSLFPLAASSIDQFIKISFVYLEKITYYIKQNPPRTGLKTSGIHPKAAKLNSVSGDTVRVKRKRGERGLP